MRYLVLLLLMLSTYSGQCCMNEYRALLNGKIVEGDVDDMAPRGRFNQNNAEYLQQKLHDADSIYRRTGTIEDYSDWATLLVYNGQYAEAKSIFQEIERKSPGRYQTAANLGTTYELLGLNDYALLWIKRAIAINPDSHRGSEWIHVKILEAKIKAKGDEQYLWDHSILSLDFGNDRLPVNKDSIDLVSLRDHLYDQLSERMSFVKPKDPVVAQLLFDLGNVVAMTWDVKAGVQVYKVAAEYGYSSALMEERASYYRKLQFPAELKNMTIGFARDNPGLALITVVLGFVILLAGITLLIRLLRQRIFVKETDKE